MAEVLGVVGTEDGIGKAFLARTVMRLISGEWLGQSGVGADQRLLSLLVLGVYVAEVEGRLLSRTDAAGVMGTDVMNTGPKYINLAEERGLIRLEEDKLDKRKKLLRGTEKLFALINKELDLLAADVSVSGPLGRSASEICEKFPVEVGAQWQLSKDEFHEQLEKVRILREGLQRYPKNPTLYESLGEWLFVGCDVDGALEAFTQAIELGVGGYKAYQAYCTRAHCYVIKGNFEAAFRDVASARQTNPSGTGAVELEQRISHAQRGKGWKQVGRGTWERNPTPTIGSQTWSLSSTGGKAYPVRRTSKRVSGRVKLSKVGRTAAESEKKKDH